MKEQAEKEAILELKRK
jgi:transcriptional regulator of met regulon